MLEFGKQGRQVEVLCHLKVFFPLRDRELLGKVATYNNDTVYTERALRTKSGQRQIRERTVN